ncbi:hypothetical protein BBJ29_006021 [Phytophthora kernoviae]|uniref:guanylate kinase n=1 Tax=Phytophthora kernoviae TaxID=325452 RepID=A0A3F2RY31_9STRA|nr:hypothetical protein BBJ29_006021 [Phytophthora kernoviae]RLN65994.1 hypothetical protein BBP00_00002516 [Phytophthora kernoviae]
MFGYFAEKLNVKNLGELLAPTLTPDQELHAAIEQGLYDKFVYILDEQHIDPNAKNDAGNLPIHTAAYYGRVQFLEVLLAHNVDVNATCPRQNSPLHFAAAQSRDDAVKFLVSHSANPATRNRSGRTPYDVAKGDNIRQYLLPLQFQHEDPAQATSFLPPGITPSVDPMAPRPVIAPPPTSGDYNAMQGPPMGMPPQQTAQTNLYAAATHSAIPRGGPSRFARKDYRPIQADGFGSSVGNEELTAKFGNKREIKVTAPPPSLLVPPAPSSVDNEAANESPSAPAPPTAPGVNPYASNYVAKPRSSSSTSGGYQGYTPPNAGAGASAAARGPPQFKIFNPKLATNADASGAAAPAPAQVPAPMAQPPAFGSAAPAAPQYPPAHSILITGSPHQLTGAMSTAEQEATKTLDSLSFEELSLLNERKEALKKEHAAYVNAHPEIKTLLSGFMSALLLEKPQDVVAFAAEHFSAFKPPHAELQPLVIAGPSGVGKGTLINLLLEKFPSTFGFSVSHTTRGPREGEVDGVAYHFTAKDKVLKEIEAGLFLEHAEVHSNVYGTSKRAVLDVQEKGKICILDIDIQGVQQVKKSGIKAKYLFISPPSMEELEKRLRGRATETEDKIQLRVKNAAGEVEFGQQPGVFDYNLVNKVVDDSLRELLTTLKEWYPSVELK